MTTPVELKELEQKTYRAAHSDGVIDLFVGASMVVIGVAWMVIPDVLSGVTAGVAVAISPMLARRRRFVEARAGYVVFTEPRRVWERRIYTTAAALFAGLMLLARPLGALQTDDVDWMIGPDSLVVWLLGAVVLVLGGLAGLNRLYGYAFVLAASGAAAVVIETRLGLPLVVSGAVIGAVGSVLVRRFIDRHPRIEDS